MRLRGQLTSLDGQGFAAFGEITEGKDIVWSFGGGRLKLIGPPVTRYREDPVRMLRAARTHRSITLEADARYADAVLARLEELAVPFRAGQCLIDADARSAIGLTLLVTGIWVGALRSVGTLRADEPRPPGPGGDEL